MRSKLIGGWLALATSGFVFSGCITHEETVYKDVNRVPVAFENDTAARIFYEAFSKAPKSNRQESKTEVSIPIVFEHKQRVVTGENAVFNEAVALCDTNKDGKITEQEANIFAEQWPKRH